MPAALSSRAFRIAGPTSPTFVQVMPTAPCAIGAGKSSAQTSCARRVWAQPEQEEQEEEQERVPPRKGLRRKEQKLQQERDEEPEPEQEEEQEQVLTIPSAILA